MGNLHLRAIKSFYSAEQGRLITLEDDVLSIVSQVRELYGDLVSIQLDPVTEYYHFVGHEKDGTDRLIFTTPELDGRALERLIQSDSQIRGHKDPYEAAERQQDELQRERDEQLIGRMSDAGERLAHALKRGGKMDRLPLTVSVPRDLDA